MCVMKCKREEQEEFVQVIECTVHRSHSKKFYFRELHHLSFFALHSYGMYYKARYIQQRKYADFFRLSFFSSLLFLCAFALTSAQNNLESLEFELRIALPSQCLS